MKQNMNKALIRELQNKDKIKMKKAYELAKQIGALSAASDQYYSCFDELKKLLD